MRGTGRRGACSAKCSSAAKVGELAKIDCGGNPASTLHVSRATDPTLAIIRGAQLERKVTKMA